ncbi:hypothetical protein K435DRAFT_867359 [Dendrothele bispora CBS 962.96]|uniref:Hydrophobin n=1 Tax=Dendrothele bispora (strain CBS 962.96) TaxID=1314807 RepID=A0A4S8LFS7_DENBC|nr:hypothetical protein K435DRAFT_867359 [Dendrothele bispora CBS 962.96]
MHRCLSFLSLFVLLLLSGSSLGMVVPPRVLSENRIEPGSLLDFTTTLPKELLAALTKLKPPPPPTPQKAISPHPYSPPSKPDQNLSHSNPYPIVNPPVRMHFKGGDHRYDDYDYHTDSHTVQCFNTPRPDANCCNDVGCAADSGPRDVHLKCRQLDSKKFGQSAHQQFCVREGYYQLT